MNVPDILGIIAGNGVYPRLLADAARKAGIKKLIAAAFTGETDPELTPHVDLIEWMRARQSWLLRSTWQVPPSKNAV